MRRVGIKACEIYENRILFSVDSHKCSVYLMYMGA